MSFVSIPSVEHATPVGAQLLQFRSADQTLVIFKQPSDCGARLADPTFEVKPGELHIGYSLPTGTLASSSDRCEATGIFTFKNLPQDNLQIVAEVRSTLAVPPSPATGPTMAFMSVPAAPESSAGPPEVLQSRHQGEMLVIARQWAPCGQRPTDPSFDLGSGTLHVSYGLTGGASTSAGQGCVATGIFTVKGLPEETLAVAADTHPVSAIAQASPPGPSMKFTVKGLSEETLGVAADTHPVPAIAQASPPGPSMKFTVKGPPLETQGVAADTHPVPAIAQASPGPSMTFLSVPAIEQPKSIQPMLLQYRHGRELVAIVTQRSECGQRPTEPSFEVAGGIANVGYQVPAGDTCMATGIFALKNLPERNLIVSVYVNGEQAQLLCASYGDSTANC